MGDHQIPDVAPDALSRRVIGELNVFSSWLQSNSARGYIGEIGWPNAAETTRWNNIAIRYYNRLRELGMDACTWASGQVLEENDNLRQYYSTGGSVVDTVSPTALPCEQYAAVPGTNLVGAAWGRETIGAGVFSSFNPGTAGTHYFYPTMQDFAYLASHGIKTVRFSFRWERLQRTLLGSLDAGEVGRINTMLANANTAGIKVILEPHNFGTYILGTTISLRTTLTLTLDPSGLLGSDHLVDLWTRMSTAFKGMPGLYAYNLMNEPADLPSYLTNTPQKTWETISQSVLAALRANNDTTLILVPGYEFSRLAKWGINHPIGWITDSANNFMYEAHHYWDKSNGGQYPNSYDNNNADASTRY